MRTSPAPAAQAVTCPSCGGTLALRAAGFTVNLGCEYCGALLDVTRPETSVISAFHDATEGFALPLGARGRLKNVEWEVVGALARSDSGAEWSEFLLFNPYAGYRWLVLAAGKWQFGRAIHDVPQPGTNDAVVWREKRFRQDYEPEYATTDRVVGEFYWRVRAGDRVAATTYSRGAQMLSVEMSGEEVNWTHFTALQPGQVGRAFGIEVETIDSSPGGLADEPDFKSDLPGMIGMALVTLFACILILAGMGMLSKGASREFNVPVAAGEVEATVATLTLRRPYQAVTIDVDTDRFDNRWIDIDYQLIDRRTQRAVGAYTVSEHYSGRDSEGRWTEGDRNRTTKLSGIPPGTYDLVASMSAQRWYQDIYASRADVDPAETIGVRVTAYAGGAFWSNLWLVIFLLALPIVVRMWLERSGEHD